ncbi:MAG: aminotransferase class I/II-fold pyridoxal phosphate-dependent enzyme [Ruminococcaceae bacterium]|nr:aminotransferase class I/II-fold pyridoxal phosphate-dependent enzyme [Oscillospiraceae bacterium]
MNNRTPLYTALERHAAEGRVSLHTPGHKGCAPALEKLSLALDLTELPDTDALYEAEGVIAEAERLATALFCADGTVFSAGGCSLAIQAMLRCCCGEGDRIIMDRGSHRMAVNAAALLGLEPVWLMSEREWGEDGLCPLPCAADVERLLAAHPDAAAVYITSPDYMGRMCDIAAISAVCSARDVPLLVDNAHGSHLIAFDDLHPLRRGASMTACSAHKTLPVLTGGAFLSSADPKLSCRMKGAMSLFGSTSPSYLIMASLDLCRAWLQEEGTAALRRTAALCEDIRTAAVQAGFGLPDGECDPMRVTLLTRSAGISGNAAAQLLREAGFEPEYADDACVVLLPTPFVTDDQMARLKEAVASLTDNRTQTEYPALPPIAEIISAARGSERAMPLRAAALARRETVDTAASVGRTAAVPVCPCPPGVPVVMPGERICETCARLLLAMGVDKVECVS